MAEAFRDDLDWIEPRSSRPERPLAQRLAEAAAAVEAGDFPAEVIDKAKTCLIDFLSCAFEARGLPWAVTARRLAQPQPSGATIIAGEGRASAGDAAFANAVAGHGLVREDMHTASIAHLGVVVWPALLAQAETGTVSGRDLIAGAILGYEVGGRIGRHLMTADLARLYRPTGLVGPLAGAAAAGYVAGLDARGLANALAFAANTAGGLNQWPHSGADDMYFHPGFAARNALTCVALAAAGAHGSADIFEGEAGLFAAFARKPLLGDIALFPQGEAEISAVFNKPVPACNYAQTPCQVALALVEGEGVAPTRIRRVDIRVCEAAVRYPGCDGTGPFERPLQAKMSIPFGVAATFARGAIAEENYARLSDPQIARIIGVTSLTADPQLTAAYPARQGARVAVTLEDGSAVERAMDDVVFATPDLVRRRFRAAAGEALGAARAAEIEAAVDGLMEARDAGALPALCGARP